MVTVAHITKKVMVGKPFLQECLRDGIVNIFALARKITPEIEMEFGKKVNPAAIVMALRRLAEQLAKSEQELPTLAGTDIQIKSDIIAVTVLNKYATPPLAKLYDLADLKKGDFMTISQGLTEITITTNAKYKKELLAALKSYEIIKIIDGVSAIHLRMPRHYLETPGMIYLITRELALHNINITEVSSTLNELTLFLQDEKIPNAYRILKELIKRK